MKVYWYCLFAIGIATSVVSGQQPGAIRDALRALRGDTADGVEVLTRGPVHEAYAGTVAFNPEEGLAVPSIPPAAIEEVPPDQRPEGANVSWIPGYWAWDDDRSDFLWISGIWRRIPPDRQWLPGYWGRAPGGARWASGYWADAEATEVVYLPEPPESVEEGPTSEATSDDHVWLPGLWIRQQDRYVWRPGYWAEGHADWQWIPSHYVWSPRGYVFVDGYYDYPEEQRGVLFAPVYFEPRVYSQPNFTYSPSVAINGSVFGRHLFVRPNYGHYYFGDYYGSNYSSMGLSPWFSFQSSRSGYDPFYARQRWLNRQDRNWEQNVQRNYENRRDHEQSRPPRTWVEQRARTANANAQRVANANAEREAEANAAREADALAESYEELANRRDRPLRVQRLENAERQQLMERQRGIRQLREQRLRMEIEEGHEDRDEPRIPREVRQNRLALPASPITNRRAERRDDGATPPARAEAPQPDEKVEPRQRRGRRASEAPVEPRPTASGPRRERAASELDRRPDSPRETPQAERGRTGRPPADRERPSADVKPPPSEPQEKPTAPQPPKEAPKTEPPQADPKPPKADPKPPEADPKPPEKEPKEEPQG